MEKIAYLLIGGWIAVIGIFLTSGRGFYNRTIKVDFGANNILVGLIFIIIGIGIVIYSLHKKPKDFEDTVLICPKCEATFNRRDIIDQNCPQCNVKLEDLEGFYDRHPEKN